MEGLLPKIAVNYTMRRKLVDVFPTSSNSLSNPRNFSIASTIVVPLQQQHSDVGDNYTHTFSKPNPSFLRVQLFSRNFHSQPANQLHIQHTGPHGILFEALQKRYRIPDVKYEDENSHFNIPDELRRLKTSLNWLFEVWPGTNSKGYRALTSTKKNVHQEVGRDEDSDDDGEKNEKKKIKRKAALFPRTPNEQQLYDVVDYLNHKQIAIRRLVKLPWLLTTNLEVLEELVKRVHRILAVKEFQVAISFTNLNEVRLYEIASVWQRDQINLLDTSGENIKFDNRIQWMANQLSCPNEEVSDMMARFPGLSVVSLQHVSNILNSLLEEDCEVQLVKPEAIINDPWVFSSNMTTLEDRVKILRQNAIGEVKPWIFRSPERLFERFVRRRKEQRDLLGDSKDITGFLQEKLNYTNENEVKGMLQRVPSIQRATVIKLNEMIEFLLSEGFTLDQIKETPRILAHSVGTISKRLREITAIGRPFDNLQILCRTSKEYRIILEKMQRRQKIRRRTVSTDSCDDVS